ncbi:MAG TPA: hypothetical protein VM734_33220 [Kofleriaceae bacterium]|nr:hypothetical protein [Kofleriaceae bacterium]
MTDGERQRLAAAAGTYEHRQAMTAQPNTWITIATVVTVVMGVSVIATIALYPWKELSVLPDWYRSVMMFSFLPTVAAVAAVSWLFLQSLGLHLQPTIRHLALVKQRETTPDGQFLELEHADGRITRHRCRRSAASMVRVGTVTPGEIGVALCKGDAVLEWCSIPV